jgi:(R,R)-butanediol dehydrogenase/meso-butanediol dehydrogenase/diacetyl reductase
VTPGDLSVPVDLDHHYDLVAPRRIQKVAESLPPLQPDWVRVRIAFCGVCGSDMSRYTGARSATYPLSMGHEWVGVVEEIGSADADIAPGDVVTTDLNFRCGSCRQCAAGHSHLCKVGQVGRFTNRGFATRTDIHASYLHRYALAPGPHLALAEPLACVLHALNHCQLSRDDRALVIGAGGLGLCAAFALSHGWPVGGFDVTDLMADRLQRLGGVVAPLGAVVPEPTEEYAVVLDVSGTVSGLRSACDRVSPGGRLCTLSHLADDADVGFMLQTLVRKDVTLVFSYLDGPSTNLARAMLMLEEWPPAWSALLDVRPLGELPEIFEGRASSPANKVVVEVLSSADEDA